LTPFEPRVLSSLELAWILLYSPYSALQGRLKLTGSGRGLSKSRGAVEVRSSLSP